MFNKEVILNSKRGFFKCMLTLIKIQVSKLTIYFSGPRFNFMFYERLKRGNVKIKNMLRKTDIKPSLDACLRDGPETAGWQYLM